MRLLFIFLTLTSFQCLGQFSNRSRGRSFGIGIQAFDPTGINLQTFRGFFNNNNSSFGTHGVWELGVGKENVVGIAGDKEYAGGNWRKGGLRFDLNYLYPLITINSPFVVQTYVGGGLQTGNRNYTLSGKEESNFATGANLMVRVELVIHGIDLGRADWFFSVYGDIKYHTDFTESFDYLTPAIGIRLRRGR
jgi:hypothetical protein